MASRKRTIEEILNSDGDDSDFDWFSSDSDISISSDSLDSETSDDKIEDNPVNPPLDEWTSQFSDITVNDFEGDNGPNLPDDFDPVSARPIDYFSLLFGMELFETIATHTNNYARWKLQDTTDRNWIETTARKIRAYIGMEILMGICQYPEANMYWSKNRYLGHPGIADVMPRNRYSKIKQYFHVSDRQAEPARNSPAYDRLFKVRPIIDHVSNSFLQRYTLGQDVAIDEAMVKFTGKLSFCQYMPAKPIKGGIKIWMACDSQHIISVAIPGVLRTNWQCHGTWPWIQRRHQFNR